MQNLKSGSIFGILAITSLSSCVNGNFEKISNKVSESLRNANSTVAASASLEIRNENGTIIYQQSNPGSTLTLVRGSNYRACLHSDNPAVQITLKRAGTTIASGPSNQCYDLNLVGVAPGNYPLELTAIASGNVDGSQRYTLATTCMSSEVAAMNISDYVSGVSVALNNALANSYSYQPTGPRVAGADCAIDMNGDNIVDTEFLPCSQAFTGYSNHVGSRNLRVYVREKSCNMTLVGSFPANLPFTAPSVPTEEPFVNALVESSIAAPGRASALNLHHLTTGADKSLRISCGYSNGTLTVQAYNRYDVRRGVGSHGMRINFGGLTGTLKDSNVATTSSTQLTGYQFITDEEVDLIGNDPIEFNGNSSNCRGTLAVENIDKMAVCEDGTPTRAKTIIMRGNFGCSNLNDTKNQSRITVGEGSSTMSGAYTCAFIKLENCPIGGGGSDGGIPPMAF